MPVQRVHGVRPVCAPEDLVSKPWLIAALASWGIALFENLLQVPANRIGYTDQPLKLDYFWAALCILGAVYFVFRF